MSFALRQLVYASVAAAPNTPQALEDLLLTCRPRNRAVGVTGLLVAWRDRYMQCLEGPPAAIGETYARIMADPRHHSLVVLLDDATPTRGFAGWDMACTVAGDSTWLQRSRTMWEDHKDLVEVPSPGFVLMKRAWEARAPDRPGDGPSAGLPVGR